jgi:hypothetical protein
MCPANDLEKAAGYKASDCLKVCSGPLKTTRNPYYCTKRFLEAGIPHLRKIEDVGLRALSQDCLQLDCSLEGRKGIKWFMSFLLPKRQSWQRTIVTARSRVIADMQI